MGGGKKSKAPSAPDYTKVAMTEAAENRKTAEELTRWNRPTQIDAFGNRIDWTQDANGNWTQKETLSPMAKEGQSRAMNGYNQAIAQAQQKAGEGFKGEELGKITNRDLKPAEGFAADAADNRFENTAGAIGDFDRTQGDRVAADMYESAMSRLRPEQERNTAALDSQLRLQGLQPGTEAYNRAAQNLMTSQGDVTAKLGLDSTAAGYNAARDIYNTNLGGQNQRYNQLLGTFNTNQGILDQAFQNELALGNATRSNNAQDMAANNQRFQQQQANYQMPFDTAARMASLFASAPGSNYQGFGTATGYSPADLSGAAQAQYEAKMGGYSGSQNKKMGTMGNMTTLGSSIIGK